MTTKKLAAKEVLQIVSAGILIISSLALPNLPIAIGAAYKGWKNFNKRDLRKILKRLEKQQMINLQEHGENVKITITDRGRQRLLEYDFENIKLKSRKRDRNWRVIIFDIPENKKKSRDALRKKLLQLGFTRLQDSVYASAYPCRNEIDFLCHYLGISDFVTTLVVAKIERGEQLTIKPLYDWDNTQL